MTATSNQPWNDYPEHKRKDIYSPAWDAAAYPFVVRWSIPYPDRLTRWVSRIREFSTLEEAIAAYLRPFKGLSVDLVQYNGKPPGQHLDVLARRKCTKPTKWSNAVPVALRKPASAPAVT